MAVLGMLVAWNKVEGIAVDTHVNRLERISSRLAENVTFLFRVANRLDWASSKDPNIVEKQLMALLPR